MLKQIADAILPENTDSRADGYPLMDSFWSTALISITYVVIVYVWRKILVQRQSQSKPTSNGHSSKTAIKPEGFGLVKILMILYNISMVLFSSFIVFETVHLTYRAGYTLGCVPVDKGSKPIALRLVRIGYLFYITKFIELLDTIFFLWRGKIDQVSFLHVFHHASMPPSVWWGVRYAPGGMVFIFPLINSIVHIIMYTYYGLSAAGLHRFLWWKKHLTALQMIQFLIYLVHQGQVFVRREKCDYPKVFPVAICIYSAIFFALFGNFYMKAYWRHQRPSKVGSTVAANGHSNGISHVNGTLSTKLAKESKKAV